ncbi:MAG: hypothetical protein DWQ05_19500 [Calditrichaeota bacterium]|nr:MAG: hypothetical protein DWQ05_19500 [Calditrichota bacterium]
MKTNQPQNSFISRSLQSSVWGHIHEAIREAFATIKNNKMRSGLVILGVLIGISSLMAMVATVAGLNSFIASSMSGQGTPIVSLSKIDFLAGESMEEMMKRKNFTIADAKALENIPHVIGVQVQYGRGMTVRYRDRKAQLISVVGSNVDLLYVQNITVSEGRYFTENEIERRRPSVVLGNKVAESLFKFEDPIGKRIRIENREYEILGVFSDRKTIFGGMADNFLVLPYTTYQRDFMFRNEDLGINIIVDNNDHVEDVEESVRALMRMRRKVPLGEADDFAVIPVDEVVKFTKSITDQVALVLVVLASIALMIGGIGVMVIMLVSVTERTHEIGIRKAIGASRGQITWQFLIEAAVLSGLGGLLGLLTGGGLAFLISMLLGFPFILPLGWVIFAVFMSVSVGLFFGIFPARKAAQLDPIEALRYE